MDKKSQTTDYRLWQRMWKYRGLYLLLLPSALLLIVFWLTPLYGVTMAFQDFTPAKGLKVLF